jgi:hypothetical protein
MTERVRAPRTRRAAPDVLAAGVLGVGIALALSALLLLAKVEGVTRLPMPLGAAFAGHLFGAGTLGMKGVLAVGVGLHVGYVGTATVVAVLAFGRHLGAVAAFGTALVLWVVAGVTVLPYVGWGLFGAGLGTAAAVNVLAVHVVYGAFLWAGAWMASRSPATTPSPAPETPRTAPLAVQR